MQEHDSQKEKDEENGITHPGALLLQVFAALQQPFGHERESCYMKEQANSNDQCCD
jgi:hypothetical protein